MKTYDVRPSRCPKCGEDLTSPYAVTVVWFTTAAGERLKCTCCTCGYDWLEPTYEQKLKGKRDGIQD